MYQLSLRGPVELCSNLLLIADPMLVTCVVMKIASWRSYNGCFNERVTDIRPLRQVKVFNVDLTLAGYTKRAKSSFIQLAPMVAMFSQRMEDLLLRAFVRASYLKILRCCSLNYAKRCSWYASAGRTCITIIYYSSQNNHIIDL